MSKVTVHAGVCGFSAVIKVQRVEGAKFKLKVSLASPCEMLKKMGEELGEVDWRQAITRNMCDSVVYQIASKHICHAACPVPSAVLKAIEVEAELALPRDVKMKVEK